jgi:hypothetical protein
MPYCMPWHYWHDTTNELSWCGPCDAWHHAGYSCDFAAAGGTIAPSAGDIDLARLWLTFHQSFQSLQSDASRRQYQFREYLRGLVTDPDALDEFSFCTDCGEPGWDDDFTGGVCETCWENYSACESCDVRYPDDNLTETLSESYICDSCRDDYFSYCDYCDGYYPDDDAYEHRHDNGDECCESPQLAFQVRSDGAEPLANDTRAPFTLPAGTISPDGMWSVRRYLRDAGCYQLAGDLDAVGDQWQTKSGNFAKRLSRHAYQTHQAKLTPEIMSQVGCIARDHSRQLDIEIEVTREFNQPASYFLHEESCYWGGYSESRCALKTNGAFGLRSFTNGSLSGRAWVMPLRQDGRGNLRPTFDTMTPDAFVVFNGYGDLGGYAPARIMAHLAGWTYRKIGFGCDPMYINAGGYLIAPEDIAGPYTDGSLRLSVGQHARLYESELSHA